MIVAPPQQQKNNAPPKKANRPSSPIYMPNRSFNRTHSLGRLTLWKKQNQQQDEGNLALLANIMPNV